MLGQAGLVPGSGVLMNDAFVDHLVDERDGRVQKFRAASFVAVAESSAELFDLRSQLAAVGAVDRVALDVLTDPFFG